MDPGRHLQSALSSLHAAQGMMTQGGSDPLQRPQPAQQPASHRTGRLDLAESYLNDAGPSTYFSDYSSGPQSYQDSRQPGSRPDTRDGYMVDANGFEGEFDYLEQEGGEMSEMPTGVTQQTYSRASGMHTAQLNGQSSTNTSASPGMPRPPEHHSHHPRSLEDTVAQFWAEQMYQVEHEPINLKHGGGPESNVGAGGALPLARIKKVMKSDPDVKMISAEAPVLLAKACEIFITELTTRAWQVAEQHKRRTLQKSDVAGAIVGADMFDFLLDIVPREEAVSKSELGLKRRNEKNAIKREEKRRKQQEEEKDEADERERGEALGDPDAEVQAEVG